MQRTICHITVISVTNICNNFDYVNLLFSCVRQSKIKSLFYPYYKEKYYAVFKLSSVIFKHFSPFMIVPVESCKKLSIWDRLIHQMPD